MGGPGSSIILDHPTPSYKNSLLANILSLYHSTHFAGAAVTGLTSSSLFISLFDSLRRDLLSDSLVLLVLLSLLLALVARAGELVGVMSLVDSLL